MHVLTPSPLVTVGCVVAQNDAAEYVSKLVARLEKRLKTTPQRQLVESLFGGLLVTQLIRGCCNNTSERLEPFVTMEVNIKGKASVTDSLRSFVKGEVGWGAVCVVGREVGCVSCTRR